MVSVSWFRFSFLWCVLKFKTVNFQGPVVRPSLVCVLPFLKGCCGHFFYTPRVYPVSLFFEKK
jgi:hypothetical protein